MPGVIAQEWFESVGGSEKVADTFATVFPDADVACLWNDGGPRPTGRPVRESWLARTPLRRNKVLALPWMSSTWRSLPARYDFVLSSSSVFAHHARAGDAPRLAYVHSPARWLWAPDVDPRAGGSVRGPVAGALRAWDRKRAAEVDSIAVSSSFVAERIARCWDLPARVIHPAVDVDFYAVRDDASLDPAERTLLAGLPDAFLLGVSRFVPHKRLDLVLATGALVDLPVVLVGDGPLAPELRAQAVAGPVPAWVLQRVSDRLLRALLQRAAVVVFPAVEDFGLVPVEAMAAGTPVVGPRRGGVSETVVDGVTGVLVDEVTAPALAAAIPVALALDPAACRARAADFLPEAFADGLRRWVGGVVGHLPVGSPS